MSKKILSLALAVIMLFSVCAVAANAAVAEGKSIGLKFVSDATVGAPAGTEVNVKVYYTIPDDAGEVLLQNGPIAVAWNSAAYAPKTTSTNNTISDCREWGASYVGIMKSTANVTKAPSATIINNQNNNSTNPYGWDAACQVTVTMDSSAGYSTNTGFPVDPDCEFFTITFIAQRTLTADDVIGAPDGAYGTTNFKIQAKVEGSNTPSLYAADVIDFSTAVSAPSAPTKADVYKLADPRKHSNGDGTNTVAVFFAFDSIAPDFNTAGTSQFISAIAATVTATSGSQSITVESDPIKYVYDLGEGEYGFRVILKNVPDAADITVVPAVTTTDSATYDVETVSFNVADATVA